MSSWRFAWACRCLVAAALVAGLVAFRPAEATQASGPIEIKGRPGIHSMTLEFVCLLSLPNIQFDIYGIDGLKVTSPVPKTHPGCRQYERIAVPVRWERGGGKGVLVVFATVSGPTFRIGSERIFSMDRRQLVKAIIPYFVAGLLAITALGLVAIAIAVTRRRLLHAPKAAPTARTPRARTLLSAAIVWLAIVVPLCAGLSWYASR